MDLREEFLRVYHTRGGSREGSAPLSAQPLPELEDTVCIAVINQKGGCGKTTTAVTLSTCLAETGYNVLLLDLDPQAHATLGLGLEGDALDLTLYHLLLRPELAVAQVLRPTHHRHLRLIPSNGLLAAAQVELLRVPDREQILKRKLEEVRGLFHFILADCPPSLNVLTLNALTAADRLIIPVQTQYYSLDGMRELFKTIEMVRERSNPRLEILGILPTLFDARTKLNRAMLKALQEYFQGQIFETVVRLNSSLAESPMLGQPVTQYAPGSKGAADYRQLAAEVIRRVCRAR